MRIKFEQINNLESLCFNEEIDYEKFTKLLYHGTTLKATETSEEEREAMYQCCFEIGRSLSNYLSHHMTDEIMNFLNSNESGPLFIAIEAFTKNISSFRYGDLYVTNSLQRALSYASDSCFGELGRLVKSLIAAKERFGINLGKSTEMMIKEYKESIVEYEKSEKVIVAFENIEYKDLFSAGGESLLENPENDEERDEIEAYNRFEIEDLYDDSQKALRLIAPDYKYNGKIIRSHKFQEAFELFGNEQDKRYMKYRELLNKYSDTK